MAKRTPRRAPRRARRVAWQFLVFSDLHVSAKTFDRCMQALAEVRRCATLNSVVDVLCLGDFWDARNILSVRHLHHLLNEFQIWEAEGLKLTIIPGNHDQVSIDGQIHGVRVFEQFSNITIVTDPIFDEKRKLAFLPWRENQDDQSELFDSVPEGYTIFGHAEAPGASANTGKRMGGRFSADVFSTVRAVYLGHFHKRQKIDHNCWYIGNPYEKDFGEMGDPKGCALVSEGYLEPMWLDFEEFPKHWRLVYPDDQEKFEDPAEIDIVEIYVSRESMETVAYANAMKNLRATDIRPLPLPDPKKSVVPAFAMGLAEGIAEYAKSPETWAGKFVEADSERLAVAGRDLLAQVPDAGVIVPLAKTVTPLWIRVIDFCAIKGGVQLPLHNQGTLLIQGEMGVGKTSLCDAMTWALYDKTTPRKSGSSGSSLRADDVIHDDAAECLVELGLLLDGTHEVVLTRTKQRNKGSKVDFRLPVEIRIPSGISDQQELVHRVIGIDYDLWRTCVYLGQGSVGNFITDADKKRKELLSSAFQLGACTHVQKHIRGLLKKLRDEMAPIQHRLHTNRTRLETLEASDFSVEMKDWETRRTNSIATAEQLIADAQARVTELDGKLTQAPQWEELEKQHTSHLVALEAQLTASVVPERAGRLHAAIGAAEAEKGLVERDLMKLRKSYAAQQQVAHGSLPTCPECGQVIPLETFEQKMGEIEGAIHAKTQEVSSLDHVIANNKQQLGQLVISGSSSVDTLKQQVNDARQNVQKVRQGLDALNTIRMRRADLVKDWEAAIERIKSERAMINPFEARQLQKETQATELKRDVDTDTFLLKELDERQDVLAYWEDGFGAKGVPVLVLRTVLHELETYANRFMAKLTSGRVFSQLEMIGDDLKVRFFKFEEMTESPRERSFLQLSGGERRCAEMAFSPFALSEMIFSRTGVRIPLLVIDELTTHLSAKAKPQVCSILGDLGRDTVIVIDHDPSVQAAFDQVYETEKQTDGSVTMRRL